MASRVVANAPNLLSSILSHYVHRPYNVSPLVAATRTFSSRSPPQNGSHPFLRAGELGPCRVDKKKDYYVMRVDVPGIPEEKMKLWVESGHIYFSARDSDIQNYNYDGRVYEGSFFFNPKKFDSDKVRSEVRDGVMWIVVPRLKK